MDIVKAVTDQIENDYKPLNFFHQKFSLTTLTGHTNSAVHYMMPGQYLTAC